MVLFIPRSALSPVAGKDQRAVTAATRATDGLPHGSHTGTARPTASTPRFFGYDIRRNQ